MGVLVGESVAAKDYTIHKRRRVGHETASGVPGSFYFQKGLSPRIVNKGTSNNGHTHGFQQKKGCVIYTVKGFVRQENKRERARSGPMSKGIIILQPCEFISYEVYSSTLMNFT